MSSSSSAAKEKVVLLALGASVGLTVPALLSWGLKAYRRRRSKPLKLGYWKIRGLAQPIRFLCAYTNTPWEDVFYEQGDGPEYSRAQWYSVKQTLGLAFPNLPYAIDGKRKLVQSQAILRYLGRQYDLMGKTEDEMMEVDMVVEEVRDFAREFTTLCYGENYDKNIDHFITKTLPKRLELLEAWLAPNENRNKKQRTWFVGSSPTIADFMVYEAIDEARILANGCLETKPYRCLKEFMKAFESMPQIKDYMASPRYFNRPINNKVAKFK